MVVKNKIVYAFNFDNWEYQYFVNLIYVNNSRSLSF